MIGEGKNYVHKIDDSGMVKALIKLHKESFLSCQVVELMLSSEAPM